MSNVAAETEIGGASPLLLKVLSLNAKIKNGTYSFEDVPCFCGNSEGYNVINKDRYGIFYSMNLCPKCGVMYASPRMTKDSSELFYQHEYRDIYEYGTDKVDEWEMGKIRAEAFKTLIDDHDIKPNIVFDIGCNMGQHLEQFKDSETYGIDYSEANIEYGKDRGLNIRHGGIDELEKLGKKADLIILSHVLEHFNDIRADLERIKNLLTSEGYLYIEVPGLYYCDPNLIFQNAHNWQFNNQTLTFVMNACGWSEIYSDAQIKSLWKHTGNGISDFQSVARQAREIYNFIFTEDKIVPTLVGSCKFKTKKRKDNIDKSLAFKLDDISILLNKHTGKEAIIIGGGPSVNKYADKIKSLQGKGNIVVAIERMYQWCISHNIIPDYVVALDASDDVVESFVNIHDEVTHVISTVCNTDVFERLAGKKSVIFSSAQANINIKDYFSKHEYNKATMINTGGSVTLGSMSVAMFLGMKNFNIFGFDCHITNGNYADGITGVGEIKDIAPVEIDGRDFTTTVAYISFAQQFFQLWKMGQVNNLMDKVRIYGDSMVKAMSKIDIDGDKEDA